MSHNIYTPFLEATRNVFHLMLDLSDIDVRRKILGMMILLTFPSVLWATLRARLFTSFQVTRLLAW